MAAAFALSCYRNADASNNLVCYIGGPRRLLAPRAEGFSQKSFHLTWSYSLQYHVTMGRATLDRFTVERPFSIKHLLEVIEEDPHFQEHLAGPGADAFGEEPAGKGKGKRVRRSAPCLHLHQIPITWDNLGSGTLDWAQAF